MSVIEGHAEHVMDAAAGQLDPGYARLRERLEARRASRGGLGEVILRLLGLELKLRQYRLGKAFCDAVVEEAGIEGLNRVWRAPEALPTLAELEQPEGWLRRVGAGVGRPGRLALSRRRPQRRGDLPHHSGGDVRAADRPVLGLDDVGLRQQVSSALQKLARRQGVLEVDDPQPAPPEQVRSESGHPRPWTLRRAPAQTSGGQ